MPNVTKLRKMLFEVANVPVVNERMIISMTYKTVLVCAINFCWQSDRSACFTKLKRPTTVNASRGRVYKGSYFGFWEARSSVRYLWTVLINCR